MGSRAGQRRRSFNSELLIGAALLLAGCSEHDYIYGQITQHNNGYTEGDETGDESTSYGDPTDTGSDSTDVSPSGGDTNGSVDDLPVIDRFLINGSLGHSNLTNYGTAKLLVETSNFDGDDVRFYWDGDLIEQDEGIFENPSPGIFSVEVPIYREPDPVYMFGAALVEGDTRVDAKPVTLTVDLPSSKTVAWDGAIQYTGDSTATAVAFDPMGSIYATGSLIDSLTGRSQLWIAKFSLYGQQEWLRTLELPGTRESRGTALAVDRVNNVVVIGDTYYTVDGVEQPHAYVAAKFSDDGTKLWVTEPDEAIGERTNGLALYYPDITNDSNYRSVVVGDFDNQDDGHAQGFIRLLDMDGSIVQQQVIAYPGQDAHLNTIALGSDNAVYTGGSKAFSSQSEGLIVRYTLPDLKKDTTFWEKVLELDVVTDIAVADLKVIATGYRYATVQGTDENDNPIEVDLTRGLAVAAERDPWTSFEKVYLQDSTPAADESLNAIALDKFNMVFAGTKSYADGFKRESISFFPPTEIDKLHWWFPDWSYLPEPDDNYSRRTTDIVLNPTSDFVVYVGTKTDKLNPDNYKMFITALVR